MKTKPSVRTIPSAELSGSDSPIGTCYVEFNWAIRYSYSSRIILFYEKDLLANEWRERVPEGVTAKFCPHEKT